MGQQRIPLIIGMACGIVPAPPLPDPEMSPLRGGAVDGPASSLDVLDLQDPGETRFRFILGPTLAASLPGQGGAAARSTETFRNAVGQTTGFKTKLHFGMPGTGLRHHGALGAAGDFGLEEQGPVRRLNQRALARFVRPANDRPGRIECDREILMDPVIPDGDGKQAHGGNNRKFKGLR